MNTNILTIHSVNPTGMFSYGLSKDINLLNKGLVHLIGVNEDKSGDSNGAGKSSLFNSVCELLFRENPTGCKNDDIINSMWDKGMAGRIMFTNHLGEHYRVTYCRNWKDSLYPVDNDSNVAYLGTSLFLDKFEEGIWKDCRGSGMPQTHQKILDIVGMSYERFLAITYMSYRVGDQFLRGTNKDRMSILSGITGVGEWDSILDKSRAKKKALVDQITAIEKKINFEQGSLQTLQETYQVTKASDWNSYIESEKELLKEAKADWKVYDSKIKSLEKKISEVSEKKDNSSSSTKLAELTDKIRIKQAELSKFTTSARPSPSSKIISLQEEQMDKSRELNSKKGMLRAFLGEEGSLLGMTKCPTCETDISDNKKHSIKDKVSSLEMSCSSIEQSIEGLKKRLEEETKKEDLSYQKVLKENQKQREEINEEISELYKDVGIEKDIQNSYYRKINEYQSELTSLKVKQGEITSKGKAHRNNIENAEKSLENLKALAGQIEEKEESVNFYKKEIAVIQTDLNVYLWLIDNIPFIKLHKMSVSMSELSNLINGYLESLGDSLRVSITSFEEKTRKKNAADVKGLLKSDVKIEIVDGSKNISPKLYSDGESGKISIAVIRALNELARKSGQGCNLMFLDEVFSFVDTNNSQKIAMSMPKLLKRGTVILTDNSGSVKDLIDFDHVWVAKKSSGRTVLEED